MSKTIMLALNLIIFSFFAYSLAFYEDSQYVTILDEDSFENEVIDGKDIWIIKFFADTDTDTEEYSNVYEKVAKALDGFVRVAAVDAVRTRVLAYKYNVKRLPTVIFINKDKTWTKYRGKKDDSELVATARNIISKHINDSLVEKFIDLPFIREFTKSDIDKLVKPSGRWIVAYYDSNNDLPSIFKTTFINLATQLQDIIKFGYYDFNKSGPRDDVAVTPLIMYYFGKRSKRKTLEYSGTMEDIEEVTSWALSKIRTPDIVELRDEDLLRDTCSPKKYCIISVIPPTADCHRTCRDTLESNLTKMAEKYKYYSAAWILVRKNRIPIMEKLFEITDKTELPAMVIVNVENLRSITIENFDETKALDELENVFHGKGLPKTRLSAFDKLLNEHYKPWHDEL